MSTLDIDFGTPRRSISHCVGWVLLFCAVGLAGWESWRYSQVHRAYVVQRVEQDRLQAKLRGPARQTLSGASAPSKEVLRRAMQAADRINMPWNHLFDSVETALNGQTALLALEPDTERREVRLRVEAKDMDEMLRCLKRIDAAPGLSAAYLETHQIFLQNPQRPVRFAVVARWTAPTVSAGEVRHREVLP